MSIDEMRRRLPLRGVPFGKPPDRRPDLTQPVTPDTLLAYRLWRGLTQTAMGAILGRSYHSVMNLEQRVGAEDQEIYRLVLVGLECERVHGGADAKVRPA